MRGRIDRSARHAAAALIALGGLARAGDAEDRPAGTLEGPFAAPGQDGMRGADLALKEQNGMAGGKKIEFVKVSSDATPDKAVDVHAQGRSSRTRSRS